LKTSLMRIIRKLTVLVLAIIAITALAPQRALAFEADSNETKINNNSESKFNIENGIFIGQQDDILALSREKYEGFTTPTAPKRTEEELKREEFLSKYADKINSALLPKGRFKINASAYTASADECGKADGITASGLKVKENETIACPSHFPFGVKIAITGMGIFVCEDRGGAIKSNHIDIYMKTKSDAFAFGRRNLEAEIVL
jgi:3D (Asp-Asp-Asp) domain-containing protein